MISLCIWCIPAQFGHLSAADVLGGDGIITMALRTRRNDEEELIV